LVLIMTLDLRELLQLSRIGDDLRRSDPGLVGQFVRTDRRRPIWRGLSYATLSVCALLAFAGLATSSTPAFAAGGVLLMVVYPVLLRFAEKERRRHSWPESEGRIGA
jgi:Protein of unknown function (DUF3040)